METNNCNVKYWTRDDNLNNVITMAMLGTIVFIFGIFTNLLMAIPILFNRANRRKHLQIFSIAASNILFLAVCIPLVMHASGQQHGFKLGDDCNGWLPFILVFFITKSILDTSTYTTESYLDTLFRSDDLKTAIIVFRVTSLSVTVVLPLILSCLFVWIDSYRVGIVVIVIYVIFFIVNFVCIFYLHKTLKHREQADTDTETEQVHQDKSLLPKLVMVCTSLILIGQCLINLMIWEKQAIYLNGQLIFSILVCAYNSLAFPLLISLEKRILQKFYYKNCLNHRVVVPL